MFHEALSYDKRHSTSFCLSFNISLSNRSFLFAVLIREYVVMMEAVTVIEMQQVKPRNLTDVSESSSHLTP